MSHSSEQRTLYDLYLEALVTSPHESFIDSVNKFSNAINDLKRLYPDASNKFFWEHPVYVIYTARLYDLTSSTPLSQAYEEVERFLAETITKNLDEQMKPIEEYIDKRK